MPPDFGGLVVAYRDGAPVRLRDLGRVVDSVQDTKRASWYNGQRAVVLAIQRQPGTNTVAVAERVKAEVERLRPQIPASIDIATLNDRSRTVRASVNDVKFTLFLALCLVVMVIFLFLRNLRATMIPGPVAAAVAGRDLRGDAPAGLQPGQSLPDGAHPGGGLRGGRRHRGAGKHRPTHRKGRVRACRRRSTGSREITFTVISMTLSLVAVFIPVLFLGGLIGRLFQTFAVTIGVAILVSGFVSLTLTPMLCSRWLKPHQPNERHGRLYTAIERAWEKSLGELRAQLAMGHGPAARWRWPSAP